MLTVVENRFCAAEGDSGEAASVGLASGLPAFASSSSDSTCKASCLLLEIPSAGTEVWERKRTKLWDSAMDNHCMNKLSSFSLLIGKRAWLLSV